MYNEKNDCGSLRTDPYVDEMIRQHRAIEIARRVASDFRTYRFDPASPFVEPVPVITGGHAVVGSEGNISAIVGEPKTKKTFLCTAIVAGALSAEGYMGFGPVDGPLLWVDTEQAASHVGRLFDRMRRCAGIDAERCAVRLTLLTLRELDPDKRRDITFDALHALHPRLVVIDGISDLQRNTNDPEESERLISMLMGVSSRQKCHILSVLHTNPNSDKARGHTGSSLQRKAETVLFVRKYRELALVEPQFCRNAPFETFAFGIDDEALPVLRELPEQLSESERLFAELCGAAPVPRNELVSKLVRRTGCGDKAAYMRIRRAIDTGVLLLDPQDNMLSLAKSRTE